MKNSLLLILICFTIQSLIAQEDDFRTIQGSSEIKVSGFGGPIMSFTQIGDDFVHLLGGGGGVIINNFFIGGYGVGKTNQIYYKNDVLKDNVMLYGHGGFWFGYTIMGNRAIHPVLHTQIGWGKITQMEKDWQSQIITPDPVSIDQVFVISPTAEIELNFSRFFRLGGGFTYSMVYNTDGPYTFNDFAKPGFFLSLKFGYFR